jgi:CRISPR/Cas system-associated exonuclease Cas4 (RecB family)
MKKNTNAENANLSLSAGSQTESLIGKNPGTIIALDSPGVSSQVAKQISENIDRYCVETYDGGHRTHLGASLIGDECKRKLWYIFRWCLQEPTDGRKQRLFNRGHREEARFIEWLEGIGVKVWYEDRESNPLYYCVESDSYHLKSEVFKDENSTLANLAVEITKDRPDYIKHIARAKADGIEFPQYRISDCGGHFGGSLDGIGILPDWFHIDEPVLLEFKTNGTGAGFNKLMAEGMAVSKGQHYAQTSTYGKKGVQGTKFRYVLYLNINKNDDTIHVELVKLSDTLGGQMLIKAEQIITSQVPPSRLSDNPTYIKCGYCHFKEICHRGAMPEMNCRSCKSAVPVDNAEWFCEVHKGIIPKDFIKKGCESYIPITAITQK